MNDLQNRLSQVGNPTICPAIAIIKGNKMLIGLRHYTADKWKEISVWTVPGGRCDAGETVETTLRREAEEETGITDLQINHFLSELPGAKNGDILYLFLGQTSQEPKLMEPEKFSEWKWENLDSVPDNFIHLKALELIKDHLRKN